MDFKDKIYIAGHKGLVGSAILRKLENRGFKNILVRTHDELDLTNQNQVKEFFEVEKPDYVIMTNRVNWSVTNSQNGETCFKSYKGKTISTVSRYGLILSKINKF